MCGIVGREMFRWGSFGIPGRRGPHPDPEAGGEGGGGPPAARGDRPPPAVEDERPPAHPLIPLHTSRTRSSPHHPALFPGSSPVVVRFVLGPYQHKAPSLCSTTPPFPRWDWPPVPSQYINPWADLVVPSRTVARHNPQMCDLPAFCPPIVFYLHFLPLPFQNSRRKLDHTQHFPPERQPHP